MAFNVSIVIEGLIVPLSLTTYMGRTYGRNVTLEMTKMTREVNLKVRNDR